MCLLILHFPHSLNTESTPSANFPQEHRQRRWRDSKTFTISFGLSSFYLFNYLWFGNFLPFLFLGSDWGPCACWEAPELSDIYRDFL